METTAKNSKWYVITLWDGKGSGEKLRPTKNFEEAMRSRHNTRDLDQTEYTVNDFYRNDIECTTMDVYNVGPSERIQDKEPILSLTWY